MKMFSSKLVVVFISFVALIVLVNLFLYESDLPLADLLPVYTNEQSKFVEIDGMNVHYKIEGEGEPLVLVHGTAAILQTWDGWVQLLSPHFKIIRMDIPAFGLTGPRADGDYSDSMYVDFIDQFVEKIGIDSFHLAGNSLGGLITWKYAAAHPTKVKKMILLDPAGFHEWKEKGGTFIFNFTRSYPKMADLFSKIGTKYMVKKALLDVYADDSKVTEGKVKMYLDLNRRAGNRKAFVDRAKYARQDCREAELAPITANTLVMWGNQDVLIDVREAEHFKKIPNAKFVFYDKVGHVPMEEIPELSAKDALLFLKGE